jgi:hypothetical protein
MTRGFVLVAALLSVSLAQSGATLEVFKPAPLPETIKPNPIPKTMMDYPDKVSISGNGSCSPSLKNVMIPADLSNAKPNPTLSKQLAELVIRDQAPRLGKPDPDGARGDRVRREKVLPLIQQAVTSEDFINIALIFQHGDCVEDFMLANRLASIAIGIEDRAKVKSKSVDPRQFYAITLDRALQRSRKAQKFGTQYSSWKNDCTRLYVTDPRTTDAERAEYNVPPLRQAIADAKKYAVPGCKNP